MEFSYDKLKGKIKEKFGTQEAFAAAVGMSRTTLNAKLNNSSEFTQSEMFKALEVLSIKKNAIDEYFFSLEIRKPEQQGA